MLWVRVPSPTPYKDEGIGVAPVPFVHFPIGASPSGKARDFDSLIRWFESSRPSQNLTRQRFIYRPDSVAQSAEQLPFKQWVRGSNPRRVTTSEQAAYRLLRLFFKKSERTHSAVPPPQITIPLLGCNLVLALSRARFSNIFVEKRISHFQEAL